MAIVLENSARYEHSSTHTTVDDEYTVPSGTTLSILILNMRADESVTELPSWNATEDFTLINDTGSDQGDDQRVYFYGLVSPTATTADVDYTLTSNSSSVGTLLNYSGTISSTVAAATNHLSDVNTRWPSSSDTAAHSSAGTSGATMIFAGAVSSGLAGATNNASFTDLFEELAGSFAYYSCHKIGGAPSAITVTYGSSDQTASTLIEILPATASSPTANLSGALGGCFRGVL